MKEVGRRHKAVEVTFTGSLKREEELWGGFNSPAIGAHCARLPPVRESVGFRPFLADVPTS